MPFAKIVVIVSSKMGVGEDGLPALCVLKHPHVSIYKSKTDVFAVSEDGTKTFKLKGVEYYIDGPSEDGYYKALQVGWKQVPPLGVPIPSCGWPLEYSLVPPGQEPMDGTKLPSAVPKLTPA
jgi:hypothetical protein